MIQKSELSLKKAGISNYFHCIVSDFSNKTLEIHTYILK